jgi:hypothetical protein
MVTDWSNEDRREREVTPFYSIPPPALTHSPPIILLELRKTSKAPWADLQNEHTNGRTDVWNEHANGHTDWLAITAIMMQYGMF